MKRLIAEWLWRVAVICALVWIALELHFVHEDMMQPVDEAPVVTADTYATEQDIGRVRCPGDRPVDVILMARAARKR